MKMPRKQMFHPRKPPQHRLGRLLQQMLDTQPLRSAQ
jgi:hypothetical protein